MHRQNFNQEPSTTTFKKNFKKIKKLVVHTWNALDKDGVILQLKLNENLHNYRVLNNRTKNLTGKKERTQVAAALIAGAPEPHPTSLQRQQRKSLEEAHRRLGRRGRAEREPSHCRENERLARENEPWSRGGGSSPTAMSPTAPKTWFFPATIATTKWS